MLGWPKMFPKPHEELTQEIVEDLAVGITGELIVLEEEAPGIRKPGRMFPEMLGCHGC